MQKCMHKFIGVSICMYVLYVCMYGMNAGIV